MADFLFGMMLIGIPVGLFWYMAHRASMKRRKLDKSIFDAVESQLDALARQRTQKVYRDAYGNPKFEKWIKELKYFRDNVVIARASAFPTVSVVIAFDNAIGRIDAVVMQRQEQMTAGFDFHDQMHPSDFEKMCAALLRKGGWSAELTPGSGDQGADVIATKNGTRVVLQCKCYRSPVGNKAVQEISAARLHFRANHGVVVTNSSFTSSARQLAASTKTLLIHHSELVDFDAVVAGAA